jgi:hypothetical protein
MPEPEAKSISGGPTPEPPQDASEIARKIEREARDKNLGDKAKSVGSELDREVSGEYEAKQERDAALDANVDPATDPTSAPPRQPGD